MGEWEAWLKAGTGDDKTDIVVIADFWERTGGVFSPDRDLTANAFRIPFGGIDNRSGNEPGRVGTRRLLPSMFFGPGGVPIPGVNTPLPHSAPNAATSPFYKRPYTPFLLKNGVPPNAPGVIAPNAFPGAPGSSVRMQRFSFHNSARIIRAAAITSPIISTLPRQRFLP